ncbi:radical SAM protein [Myxococcota bacterium]|nr:radical SAM protein [Myxococcota bacterium]
MVNHCNLTCDHCCSYSPLLSPSEVDPDELTQDLHALKGLLKPQLLKIVGGEPTLHSNLFKILSSAKAVQIAPQLSLTTNGCFLDRITDECLMLLDHITISVYSLEPRQKSIFKSFIKRAKKFTVILNWKIQDTFSQMDRGELSTRADAESIFQSCWIHDRCHSVRRGVFYCCTRTQYLKDLYGETPFTDDGVRIRDTRQEKLLQKIHKYLNRTEPLNSCRLCYGGQAPLRPHRLLSKKEQTLKKAQVKELCRCIT